MDIGLTFSRTFAGPHEPAANPEVEVDFATERDVDSLLETVLDAPWGSRYEADPAYAPGAVRELRARWLRNSLAGRADAFLIGFVDGVPAGYVTCRIHGDVGEIDLVGTAPAYRRRRVAATVVDHALGWFSTRVADVTVRTQATNFAAAQLYERSGLRLLQSDLTYRLALTERGGSQ
jgi:ribosomal protein S18 acetylase RimI-like enzyme